MRDYIQSVLLFQKKQQTQKILMMDLLFKIQAQLVQEQALIFHSELLMQLTYSIIVIQDLLVPVLHLQQLYLLELNYLIT